MTEQPIEIRLGDLVGMVESATESPEGEAGAAPAFNWQKAITDIRRTLELVTYLSHGNFQLNLPGISQGGNQPNQAASDRPQVTPQQQVGLLIKMMGAMYGDVTVSQLIDKLKADFGDKKLSELVGGK